MNRTGASISNKIEFFLNKFFTGNSMTYKQVFAIIIPIFVDTSFIVMMSILNTAMISSSGMAAISAVSTVDSLNMFIVSIFIAVATGGTVIVAQFKGSGNREMVSRSAAQAITVVTVLAIMISVIVIIWRTPTLNLLFGSAEAEVLENAKIYLIGSCISFPFMAVHQAAMGVLRGVSETKSSLVLSLILNITLLVLNFVLIKGLDMGVVGLSISLIIARFVGAGASIIYLTRYNHTLHFRIKNALKLNVGILKKIMFIGLPFAAEQLFFNGGKLITQTFIVQFGTVALTVNAISNSLSMLLQIGGSTLSIAIVTIVGQSIGRRDIQDARKFIKSILWLSAILLIVFSAILLPLFPLLMRMYAAPDEIVSSIFTLVLLLAIAQPILWTLSFIIPSALRAAGDSTFTSVASLLSMWLFRVVLGYILGVTLGFGLIGVWIAMVAEWGVRSIIFAWRLKGDKWYKHKLV
jgi:putative MATE family efflux protein